VTGPYLLPEKTWLRVIEPGAGRPRVHGLREILDAIFYLVRSGCAWRMLPNDFPPWADSLLPSIRL
jgi:putative transposase